MKYDLEICKVVSRNLREKRSSLGYSQEKLAEVAHITPLTVWKIENQEVWPSPETVTELAQALNIKPYELFLDEYTDNVLSIQDVGLTKQSILAAVQETLDKMLPKTDKPSPKSSYSISRFSRH